MESVSHHILPQMLVSPLWVDLNNLLKDYLKFMDDHFRESADLTFLAYRHRNYSKVRTNCQYTYFFGPTLLQITCYMVQRFTGSDRFIIFLYICFITLYTRQGMVCQHFFSSMLLLKCLQELSFKSFQVYTFVFASFLSVLRVQHVYITF